ncbi:MAG TPA: hypothetical protein VMN39_05600, partial [Longimicrobiaceae bacterium]|nr:hypothetical protein [Longimicrobiaceae bacterium]
ELFGVNAFGQLVAHVRVAGAENVDWEDIAAGPCPAGNCLYIGDIGDNAEDRAEVVIYRIPEPSIETDVVPAEAFPVRYPDGPQDAEGLFVLPPDQLFVVTKGAGRPISIYRYPGSLRAGEVVELELVRRLTDRPVPLSDRVTAADATPDGRRVALRTRTTLLLYDTDVLLGNVPGEPANVRIEMLGEPQGEGVAFGPRGAIVLTGEAVAEGFASTLGILWCP